MLSGLYNIESITRNSKRKKIFMSEYKPCMLRLRVETHEMLRDAVEKSAHRSMSALADEIIYTALAAAVHEEESRTSVDRMISAARR